LTSRSTLHWAVIAVLLLPLLGLTIGALTDGLGANPVETLTHETGEWALRYLLLCLAVTPARRLLGWSALARYRRSLGLLAFGYAVCHFLVFLVFDLGLDLTFLAEEITERPYVTVGFAALMSMLPLAVTSTRGWQRRLGRRWVRLHRLVYASAALAVLHLLWLTKADLAVPLAYAAVLGLLLGLRRFPLRKKAPRKRAPDPSRAASGSPPPGMPL